MSWALKDKSVYKDLVQYVAAKRALTFYEASSCLVFLNFYVAVIQLTKFTVSNLTISGIDDAKRPMEVWALHRGLLFGEWMLLGGKGLRQ